MKYIQKFESFIVEGKETFKRGDKLTIDMGDGPEKERLASLKELKSESNVNEVKENYMVFLKEKENFIEDLKKFKNNIEFTVNRSQYLKDVKGLDKLSNEAMTTLDKMITLVERVK